MPYTRPWDGPHTKQTNQAICNHAAAAAAAELLHEVDRKLLKRMLMQVLVAILGIERKGIIG